MGERSRIACVALGCRRLCLGRCAGGGSVRACPGRAAAANRCARDELGALAGGAPRQCLQPLAHKHAPVLERRGSLRALIVRARCAGDGGVRQVVTKQHRDSETEQGSLKYHQARRAANLVEDAPSTWVELRKFNLRAWRMFDQIGGSQTRGGGNPALFGAFCATSGGSSARFGWATLRHVSIAAECQLEQHVFKRGLRQGCGWRAPASQHEWRTNASAACAAKSLGG